LAIAINAETKTYRPSFLSAPFPVFLSDVKDLTHLVRIQQSVLMHTNQFTFPAAKDLTHFIKIEQSPDCSEGSHSFHWLRSFTAFRMTEPSLVLGLGQGECALKKLLQANPFNSALP
jgi:hypothetical protein